jgi:WD40 repeat protein
MKIRLFIASIATFSVLLAFAAGLNAQNAQVLPFPPAVLAVEWNVDGSKIVGAGTDGTLRVWDTATGTELLSFSGLTEQLLAVAWSLDGDRLVSGGVDGIVRVWDAESGQLLGELQHPLANILGLDWSPDGTKLASVSFGGENNLRIWDANTYQLLNQFTVGDIFEIEWRPDGKVLALPQAGGGVLLVDPANEQPFQSFSLQERTGSVAWNTDGSLLAIGHAERGEIYVWDMATDTQIIKLEGLTNGVSSVVWTSDDTQVIGTSWDTTILVWDVATGAVIDTFNKGDLYLRAIDLSPFGGRLAYGGPLPEAGDTAALALPSEGDVLSNGLVNIVVPAPSAEKLQAIAEACGAAPEVTAALTAQIATEALDSFTDQVSQLTDAQLPAGCAADLLAVAEALRIAE